MRIICSIQPLKNGLEWLPFAEHQIPRSVQKYLYICSVTLSSEQRDEDAYRPRFTYEDSEAEG